MLEFTFRGVTLEQIVREMREFLRQVEEPQSGSVSIPRFSRAGEGPCRYCQEIFRRVRKHETACRMNPINAPLSNLHLRRETEKDQIQSLTAKLNDSNSDQSATDEKPSKIIGSINQSPKMSSTVELPIGHDEKNTL